MSPSTEDLLDRIAAWERAGLLSADQAAAIRAHERDRTPGDRPPPTSRSRRADRATAAEAIGYVGAALVLGAVGLFLGDLWDGLATGGRLTLAALVTLGLAGAATALRRATSPASARLTSVLSAGVVAGVAWCTVILGDDLLGWRDEDTAVAVGAATVAAAVPWYALLRRALPQVVLLSSLLCLVTALLLRSTLPLEPFWSALPVAGVGVVWALLGEGGYLPPRRVAGSAGAVVALVGLQTASFGDHRVLALVLAITASAALVVAAVAGGALRHLAIGAVGLFVLVPQLVVELFGDAIGAPATLLLVGVLLVLLAVGLGRAKREVTTAGGAP